jgi:hypothetical protein
MTKHYPGTISTIGAVSGWLSVNLLQAAQFMAAALAAAVSLCALIIAAPKAWAEVRRWFQ